MAALVFGLLTTTAGTAWWAERAEVWDEEGLEEEAWGADWSIPEVHYRWTKRIRRACKRGPGRLRRGQRYGGRWVVGMTLVTVMVWLVAAATVTTGAVGLAWFCAPWVVRGRALAGNACERVAATLARRPARLVDSLTPYGAVGTEDGVEQVKGWNVASHLSAEQKEEVTALLEQHKGAFAWNNEDIPGYSGGEGPFKIEVTDPLAETRQRPRRLNPAEQAKVDEWYQAFLDAGYIRKYGVNGLQVLKASGVGRQPVRGGLWRHSRSMLQACYLLHRRRVGKCSRLSEARWRVARCGDALYGRRERGGVLR